MKFGHWNEYGNSMSGAKLVVLDKCSREAYEYFCTQEHIKYCTSEQNLKNNLSQKGPYRLVHVIKDPTFTEEDYYMILSESFISYGQWIAV